MTQEIQTTRVREDPWSEIDRAFDAMRRDFAQALGVVPFAGWEQGKAFLAPRTDVTDTGTAYKLVAEVPGIPKEKLDIRVHGATVEIQGEAESLTEQKDESYLRRERTYSGYYRSVELPEPVVATEAKAKVENGVLELELPKQRPTPKEDEVKVPVA